QAISWRSAGSSISPLFMGVIRAGMEPLRRSRTWRMAESGQISHKRNARRVEPARHSGAPSHTTCPANPTEFRTQMNHLRTLFLAGAAAALVASAALPQTRTAPLASGEGVSINTERRTGFARLLSPTDHALYLQAYWAT